MSGGTSDQQASTCRSPAYSVRNYELVKDSGFDDRPVDFALLRDPQAAVPAIGPLIWFHTQRGEQVLQADDIGGWAGFWPPVWQCS